MPMSEQTYTHKFYASAESWSLFEEVLAAEFQNAILFGQVHQLTVDAYAVQHSGGRHPEKSVCIHLVGLHLMLERDVAPMKVPRLLQRLASRASWPHLDPPGERASLTVFDVAARRRKHKAHDPKLQRTVAIKVLAKQDDDASARLLGVVCTPRQPGCNATGVSVEILRAPQPIVSPTLQAESQ